MRSGLCPLETPLSPSNRKLLCLSGGFASCAMTVQIAISSVAYELPLELCKTRTALTVKPVKGCGTRSPNPAATAMFSRIIMQFLESLGLGGCTPINSIWYGVRKGGTRLMFTDSVTMEYMNSRQFSQPWRTPLDMGHSTSEALCRRLYGVLAYHVITYPRTPRFFFWLLRLY